MTKAIANADEARPFRNRVRDRNREKPATFEDLPAEEWRPIPSAPGYEASNLGRIRSWRSTHGHRRFVPKLRKLRSNVHGYAVISYVDDVKGKFVTRFVHHLVLEAFVGPKPATKVARHLDGDHTNNRRDNLAWGTSKENAADKVRHGTSQHGERNHQAKLSNAEADAIRSSRELGRVLAARYGVAESLISRIRNGVRRAG